jgi:ABC-2 type transport system permease protein
MNMAFRQIFIIAWRDFKAVAGTPTFLLFLLAPLFMILIGVAGGMGAGQVASNAVNATRIAVLTGAEDAVRIKAAHDQLRAIIPGEGPPQLEVIKPEADPEKQAAKLMASQTSDYVGVMLGSLEKPKIYHSINAARHGRYLAALAEGAERSRISGAINGKPLTRPQLIEARAAPRSIGGRQATASLAVFGIFFLTLFLAGQGVGMLAEEKSNKVIEVLAAAAPLESVFMGKLIGMFGVALLFVGFWTVLGLIALTTIAAGVPLPLNPAVPAPLFFILFALYFTTAYLLLAAVFLGVGAQAATIREIQMLSLPITVVQMLILGLSTTAASQPGTNLARFAEWMPYSSPFAMIARAANDPAILPHVFALAWQLLWVGITVWIAARMFRAGVLNSGGWKSIFRFRFPRRNG